MTGSRKVPVPRKTALKRKSTNNQAVSTTKYPQPAKIDAEDDSQDSNTHTSDDASEISDVDDASADEVSTDDVSDQGLDEGSDDGSDGGSEDGSDKGSVEGSDGGSVENSEDDASDSDEEPEGSDEGSSEDDSDGSEADDSDEEMDDFSGSDSESESEAEGVTPEFEEADFVDMAEMLAKEQKATLQKSPLTPEDLAAIIAEVAASLGSVIQTRDKPSDETSDKPKGKTSSKTTGKSTGKAKESEVTEGDNSETHNVLIAGVKDLTAVIASILRWQYRIVTSTADLGAVAPKRNPRKPNRTRGAEEAKRAATISESLKRKQQEAPYKFDSNCRRHMVEPYLRKSLELLEVVAEAINGLETDNASLKKLCMTYLPFFREVYIFFKANGSFDSYSKTLVKSLEVNLFGMLGVSPDYLLRFYRPFMSVALFVEARLAVNCLGVLKQPAFVKLAPTSADADSLPDIILGMVKTAVAGVTALGSANKMALGCLNRLRSFNDALTDILTLLYTGMDNGIEAGGVKGYGPAIYEAAFLSLQQIIVNLGQLETAVRTGGVRNAAKPQGKRTKRTKKGSKMSYRAKQADQKIYSWSTLFTLRLWISVMRNYSTSSTPARRTGGLAIADLASSDPVRLAEPITAILIAMIKDGTSQPALRPFVIDCVDLCLETMEASRRFVPLGLCLIQLAFQAAVASSKVSGNPTSSKMAQDVDLANVIKLKNEQRSIPRLNAKIMEHLLDQIIRFTAILARHPAFHELAQVIEIQLKRLLKLVDNTSVARSIKGLINAIPLTSRAIDMKRQSMVPADHINQFFVFDGDVYNQFEVVRYMKNRRNIAISRSFWQQTKVPSKAALRGKESSSADATSKNKKQGSERPGQKRPGAKAGGPQGFKGAKGVKTAA